MKEQKVVSISAKAMLLLNQYNLANDNLRKVLDEPYDMFNPSEQVKVRFEEAHKARRHLFAYIAELEAKEADAQPTEDTLLAQIMELKALTSAQELRIRKLTEAGNDLADSWYKHPDEHHNAKYMWDILVNGVVE